MKKSSSHNGVTAWRFTKLFIDSWAFCVGFVCWVYVPLMIISHLIWHIPTAITVLKLWRCHMATYVAALSRTLRILFWAVHKMATVCRIRCTDICFRVQRHRRMQATLASKSSIDVSHKPNKPGVFHSEISLQRLVEKCWSWAIDVMAFIGCVYVCRCQGFSIAMDLPHPTP